MTLEPSGSREVAVTFQNFSQHDNGVDAETPRSLPSGRSDHHEGGR